MVPRSVSTAREDVMAQAERFEVAVRGSGQGGKKLVWHLAQAGRRTAVVVGAVTAQEAGGRLTGPRGLARPAAPRGRPDREAGRSRAAWAARNRRVGSDAACRSAVR